MILVCRNINKEYFIKDNGIIMNVVKHSGNKTIVFLVKSGLLISFLSNQLDRGSSYEYIPHSVIESFENIEYLQQRYPEFTV